MAFETKEEREKKSRSYIIGTRPIVVVISISSNYSSSSLLFLFSVSLNRLEYDIAKREEEEEEKKKKTDYPTSLLHNIDDSMVHDQIS